MTSLYLNKNRHSTCSGMDVNLSDLCSPALKAILNNVPSEYYCRIQELRLRQDRPFSLLLDQEDFFVDANGRLISDPREAYYISKDDIERVFQNMTRHSVYALEEELRNGYVTVNGGHRIGFTGEAVVVNGKLKNLKNISCINIRVAREVKGCAVKILPWLINKPSNSVKHTLIISPPKCGKTTMLRDIVRQLSNGIPDMGFKGVNVGVVDERSEIAGCYMGLPQKDIGVRTDVLDKCPKGEGMYMLVRAMSPQVIVTDEIGRAEDVAAIQEVLNAGITLITSVHGADTEDIKRRPVLREIMAMQMFERLILLGRSKGAGTLEAVIDGHSGESLFPKKSL